MVSDLLSTQFVWVFIHNVLNIQLIPACHISNEGEQIPDQIYNLLFISRDYDRINLLVSYFLAHCI